jgi:hypothetical protein
MTLFSYGKKQKKERLLELFNVGFLSLVVLEYSFSEKGFYLKNFEFIDNEQSVSEPNVLLENVYDTETGKESEKILNIESDQANPEANPEANLEVNPVSDSMSKESFSALETSEPATVNIEKLESEIIEKGEVFLDVESIILNFNFFLEEFREKYENLEYFYEIELIETEENRIRITLLYNLEYFEKLFDFNEDNKKYPIIFNKKISDEERKIFFEKVVNNYKNEEKYEYIKKILGDLLTIKIARGSIRLLNNYSNWSCTIADIL